MSLHSKLTRREVLASGATSAFISKFMRPDGSDGSGRSHKYEPVPGWGKTGEKLGWGVGIVCDSGDRVYVHSRSKKAVIVFDRHGRRLNDFGAEFGGTGHGLTWHKQGRAENLYFCDHGRNLVVKTDLNGRALLRIGVVAAKSTDSIRFPFNQPTDLAVAPDGRLFVAEGYGGNRVQVFNHLGRHLYTIGGPGKAPGRFSCPHSLWIEARKRTPELYVADRSNQRIQVLNLEGKFKRSITGPARLPNGFYQQGGKMFIADLDRQITILDDNDSFAAHIGNDRRRPAKNTPIFEAPHALCVDSHGDLYVIEWVEGARVQKFRQA